jgi:N-acetylneuraminate lyase
MERFEGLIAAAHTPFLPDGSLNLAVIDEQARLLIETGVSAVFLCGTTGESHSLTLAERRLVAERWLEVEAGRLPIIVHVGHNCRADAVELAAHARQHSAAAIAAMAPSYYRPESVNDLIDFLKPIAAAAPDLPFYFYDIPDATGVRLPMSDLLVHGRDRIPTLAGIKYTSPDLMMFQACVQLEDGEFDLLFGNDELLLAGLALGTRGAVGSTYNYAAPVYRRVIEAFSAGDLNTARSEQHRAVQLVQVLCEFGVLRTGKAIMAMLGVDCGPPRAPLRPLSEQEREVVFQKLRDLDVCSRPLIAPVRGTR